MTKRANRILGWVAVSMLALAGPALAGHHEGHGKGAGGADGKGPSAEQRIKMAEHHERMAACLRSTRPFGECRAEMRAMHETLRKQCMEAGGDCPMGHDGPHHGRMGKGMNGDDAAKDKAKGKPGKKSGAPTDATTEATE